MFCKTCLKFEDKSKSSKNYNPSFVDSCSNFLKRSIVEHAKTEMYNKACEFEDMQEAQKLGEKVGEIPIGESLRKMGKLPEDRQESLEKLFHVAYHIALRGRPYTDFVHELEVQKLHKAEFLKSGTYENESACRDLLTSAQSQFQSES